MLEDATLEASKRGVHATPTVYVNGRQLALVPGDPFAQAAELREHLGPRPLLVLTLGPHGYLLDDRAAMGAEA